MEVQFYQVDAFASRLFEGNPAGVCVLESPLSEELMQQIGMENNLAETAFLWQENQRWNIRWFTPTVEVDLCGHATLASAHVLFQHCHHPGDSIEFYSPRSGVLSVTKGKDGSLQLNFPKDELSPVTVPESITHAFQSKANAAFEGKTDLMLVFDDEATVQSLNPDFVALAELDVRGVIATAPGEEVDFVSRFFAPQSGIDEDPVTGSAHTSLTPYWSEVLQKSELSARQISPRGGQLRCTLSGDRVLIAGRAHTYLIGTLHL